MGNMNGFQNILETILMSECQFRFEFGSKIFGDLVRQPILNFSNQNFYTHCKKAMKKNFSDNCVVYRRSTSVITKLSLLATENHQ